MEAIKSLFGVLIVVLLISVLGLALRETIVGKMCEMSEGYTVSYTNTSGGADLIETFDGGGIDCATNGLIYTWSLILVALGSVIGLIYAGVKSFGKHHG